MLELVSVLGARLSAFSERWVPDAWVVCMGLTAIALALALGGAGASPHEALLAWGEGVWVLLTLAMQFTIAMVAAHACVATNPSADQEEGDAKVERDLEPPSRAQRCETTKAGFEDEDRAEHREREEDDDGDRRG